MDNTIKIEWQTEVLKKIENIDEEYDKLVGSPKVIDAEIVEESPLDMDTDTHGD